MESRRDGERESYRRLCASACVCMGALSCVCVCVGARVCCVCVYTHTYTHTHTHTHNITGASWASKSATEWECVTCGGGGVQVKTI